MSSLKRRVTKGVMWSLSDTVFKKVSDLMIMLYLANIFGPQEFGIIGMIVLFVNIGNVLVDSGMSISLLRMKNPDENDYSTVFLTNLAISILVYVILYVSAPGISNFYDQPVLIPVIRIYSIGFILQAFKAIQVTRLMKQLDFKSLMLLNLPGQISSIVVAIWMSANDYGIFSFVGLYLTNQLVSCLVFNLAVKTQRRIRFAVERWRFHFFFGYKLMLSALLNTIFDNIYNVWIGKYYAIRELGYYERSWTLNVYPFQVITEVLGKITLSGASQVKSDISRVRAIYRSVIGMSFFFMCFLMSIAGALATPLFTVILGEEWLPAVDYFKVLIIGFIFFPVHSMNINLLNLMSRSDLYLKLEVVKKIIILLTLPLGIWLGIKGLLWSFVIYSVSGLYVNTFYSQKMVNYGFLKQMRDIIPTILLFLLIFLILNVFLSLYPGDQAFVTLLTGIALGVTLTILFCRALHFRPYMEIVKLVRQFVLK